MKSEGKKYAELFIAMSLGFLSGKINLEHYAHVMNMANEMFYNMVYEDLTRQADEQLNDD